MISEKNAATYYFVSYCRKDEAFVLRLVKTLQDAQVSVWLDQSKIQVGQPWDDKVEEAIEKSYGVIVVLSPRSAISRNVLNEIGYAEEIKKWLIPVVYKGCVPPLRLGRLHRIDLSEDYDKGLQVLLRCLRLGEPLPQTASLGHDTSTIPFSVEDALAFLSVAPRSLIKKLIAASDGLKWHDRLYILIVLKGITPMVIWYIIAAIGMAFIGPTPLVYYPLCGAFGVVAFLYYQKYVRRVRNQAVRLTLTWQLPRRSPSQTNGQRTKNLWDRVEPILWEIAAMPSDSWGEYIETTCADKELRQQIMSFLSIFLSATIALREERKGTSP